ncbi:MAG: hypothetical protein N3D85_05315 [Candidatus Bathyarchaeota archaeon]|nr:hypothetical protein [Candidatus Bathyarchaeota archaeon]
MAPATKLKIAKGALYEWTKEKPIRVKKRSMVTAKLPLTYTGTPSPVN